MGEDLSAPGRHSVRTPMQWSSEVNGGFSTASADTLPEPVPAGPYGPAHVSVAAQRRDPESLLNWFERVIRRRKETPEIGFGSCTVLDPSNHAVFAHRIDWDGRAVFFVHNLSDADQHIELEIDVADCEFIVDLLDDRHIAVDDTRRVALDVEPYGWRWYRARQPGRRDVP